jgi:hypothetical protein
MDSGSVPGAIVAACPKKQNRRLGGVESALCNTLPDSAAEKSQVILSFTRSPAAPPDPTLTPSIL